MFNPFRSLATQDPPPDSKVTDSYFEKLIKYIPADIVAGYVAITGIVSGHDQPLWLTWGVFGVLLALTPLYVVYRKTDPPGFAWCKTFHWVTACIAFTAWVFALGGPFATFTWYQPYLGSVVLILTTLIIPVLEGQFIRTDSPSPPDPGPGPAPTPGPTPAPAPSPGPGPAPSPAPTPQQSLPAAPSESAASGH
jgi:hypothetical protein